MLYDLTPVWTTPLDKMKAWRCRWGWLVLACCVGIAVWCTWRGLPVSNGHIELKTSKDSVGRGEAVVGSPLRGASGDSKTARLSSITSTIQSLLPQQFLPNFKNPCWYVDYQISPEILNTFLSNTPAGEDEAEKEHIAKSVVAAMHRSEPTGEEHLVCLPYFFVLGYPKCGSTKLYEILKAHPDFAPPRIRDIHWFTKRNFEEKFPNSIAFILHYLYNFLLAAETIETDPSHRITGDCSASHAFQLPFQMDITETLPNALPILLHNLLPDAKYVIIVRHPIRRLLSEFYYFAKKRCRKTPVNANMLHNLVVNRINSFNKCTAEKGDDYYCLYKYMDWFEQREDPCFQLRLEATLYVYTLQQWRKEIPPENLLVLRTEDLEVDDVAVAKRLYTFLGLTLPEESVYSKFHDMEATQQSFLHYPRDGNIAIRNYTWTLLSDFFQPYNERLAEMLQDEAFLWKE